MVNLLAVKRCYQDKTWQKMPKWQKFKYDILGYFQTLWISIFSAKIRTMLAFNVLKKFQVRILKAKVRNESSCACASCQIQVMHYTSLFVRITKEGLSPQIKTFKSFVVSTSSSSRKIIVLRKCSFCFAFFIGWHHCVVATCK